MRKHIEKLLPLLIKKSGVKGKWFFVDDRVQRLSDLLLALLLMTDAHILHADNRMRGDGD